MLPQAQEVDQMISYIYPLISVVFLPAIFPFLAKDTLLRAYTLILTTIIIKEGRINEKRKKKEKRKNERKQNIHTPAYCAGHCAS